MQINPLSIAGAIASPAASSGGSSTTNPVQDTNDMFLKLLTAQLKNQSPINPVDPMQFTSQLVQFNMLDQLTQIRSLLQQTAGSSNSPAATQRQVIPGGN